MIPNRYISGHLKFSGAVWIYFEYLLVEYFGTILSPFKIHLGSFMVHFRYIKGPI